MQGGLGIPGERRQIMSDIGWSWGSQGRSKCDFIVTRSRPAITVASRWLCGRPSYARHAGAPGALANDSLARVAAVLLPVMWLFVAIGAMGPGQKISVLTVLWISVVSTPLASGFGAAITAHYLQLAQGEGADDPPIPSVADSTETTTSAVAKPVPTSLTAPQTPTRYRIHELEL